MNPFTGLALKRAISLAITLFACVACAASDDRTHPLAAGHVAAGQPNCINWSIDRKESTSSPKVVSATVVFTNRCPNDVSYYRCIVAQNQPGPACSEGYFSPGRIGASTTDTVSIADMPSKVVRVVECPRGYKTPQGELHLDCVRE